jgi:hypothetical protein
MQGDSICNVDAVDVHPQRDRRLEPASEQQTRFSPFRVLGLICSHLLLREAPFVPFRALPWWCLVHDTGQTVSIWATRATHLHGPRLLSADAIVACRSFVNAGANGSYDDRHFAAHHDSVGVSYISFNLTASAAPQGIVRNLIAIYHVLGDEDIWAVLCFKGQRHDETMDDRTWPSGRGWSA